MENINTKTLLIDFDLDENHIRTIMKIKRKPKYINNIKDLIINIGKNFDVLCHLDYILKNEIDFFQLQEMLNKFKKEYNLIIIDTSSHLESQYTKKIFYNSDNIIFLVEPNILGVKKAKNILEVLENDWRISDDKLKIILNKTSIYQISDGVIDELFPNIKVIGKIKYNDTYNLMINRNINKREIKKEYQKIYKKLYDIKQLN